MPPSTPRIMITLIIVATVNIISMISIRVSSSISAGIRSRVRISIIRCIASVAEELIFDATESCTMI